MEKADIRDGNCLFGGCVFCPSFPSGNFGRGKRSQLLSGGFSGGRQAMQPVIRVSTRMPDSVNHDELLATRDTLLNDGVNNIRKAP